MCNIEAVCNRFFHFSCSEGCTVVKGALEVATRGKREGCHGLSHPLSPMLSTP